MSEGKTHTIQTAFSRDNNVKQIYAFVVEGDTTPELFIALGKNFVRPGDVLAKTASREMEVQCARNVMFEKDSGAYRATAWGFVHYEGTVAIEVLPVIFIPEDRSRAMMILPPQTNTKKVFRLEDAMAAIADCNIKSSVDYEAVDKAISDSTVEGKGAVAIFARGAAPVEGRVPKVVIDYDFSIDVGKAKEDGKIDFKERNFINNIKEGAQVAHYLPAIEPIDGIDIDGVVIKAKLDKNPEYKIGKNIKVDQVTRAISAAIDGILSIANNSITVNDVMEISRDVDYATGNLQANGSILIHGTVKPGFMVQAEGDVIVYGNIEEAIVIAGGNVVARGGIIGGAGSRIEANGNIKANFIRNAVIQCYGDVVVDQSIMNAEIITDARLVCQSGKGVVIGGKISANRGVFVNVAGAPSGTPTELTVGKSVNFETHLRELNDLVKNNKENIRKLKQTLGDEYFRNPKEFIMRLTPQRAPMVKQILQQLTVLVRETNDAETEKENIVAQAGKDSKSVVSIFDSAHEGVIIQINKDRRELEKTQSGSEFYYAKEYLRIAERMPKKLNPKEYEF